MGMTNRTLLVVLTVCAALSMSEAYKFLLAFPFPGKSHSILGDGYVRHLLNAGHEVTFITPFPTKNVSPKLHQIDVSSNLKLLPEDGFKIDDLMKNPATLNPVLFLFITNNLTAMGIQHENVQKLMRDSTQAFDAVIAQWFGSELNAGLAALYECPLIWASPTDPQSLILRLIDETTNPAYTTNISSGNTTPLSFTQRLEELWLQIRTYLVFKFAIDPMATSSYQELYGPAAAIRGVTLPSFDEIRYNASLILGNSHPSVSSPSRLPQNYKTIGGFHIETPTKPLPEDLLQLIESAKDGVIYFSMGSNLKSKYLSEELKLGLLKMFGELKQTVLWKFEEDLPNLPPNVHILHWAPQPSILAHPNTRLFITHGGLLSTTETVHYGVPIIGVPVFGDQHLNMRKAELHGYAIKVTLTYNLPADLRVAINKMLSDSSYAKTAKDLSALFHDRPVPPGAELVHWVEHVVRTRGVPHLRSPALMVPWYQKAYLDLAAVLLVALTLLVVIMKKICRLCCGNRVKTNKQKRS